MKFSDIDSSQSTIQEITRQIQTKQKSYYKGAWTVQEDQKLKKLVQQFGPKNWTLISQQISQRRGKQCRERWHNHLNPQIKKDKWTFDEEQKLLEAHKIYGNKWSLIAKFIPGRTDNSIKNYWNSTIQKKYHKNQKQYFDAQNISGQNKIQQILIIPDFQNIKKLPSSKILLQKIHNLIYE